MPIDLKSLNINEHDEIFQIFRNMEKNETGFENEAYGMNRDEFDLWCQEKVAEALGINLKPNRVPQNHYILYKNKFPVGISKLRHSLNDYLMVNGGHIGYTIFAEHRGKGYGKIILKETLRKACNLGIDRALLTCDETNIGSTKIITSVMEIMGGEEIEKTENDGKSTRRFWINTRAE